MQVGVPDDINDEIAAQTFITTLTVIGLVETAAVPKVSLTMPLVCCCCRHYQHALRRPRVAA